MSFTPNGQSSSTAVESREHHKSISARRVIKHPGDYQTRIEYDSNDNPIYVGVGARGLLSSSDGWTIQKLTWVSGTVSGYNMTLKQTAIAAWDDRADAGTIYS